MSDLMIGRSAKGGRSFPLSFRVEFLRWWDEYVEHGSKVRLLREFNLARPTVERWLEARRRGDLSTSLVVAGRSPHRMDSRDRAEIARLRKENEPLKKRVAQSEAA